MLASQCSISCLLHWFFTMELRSHMFLHPSHHQNSICSEHKRKNTIVTNPRTQTTSLFHAAQKTSKPVPNWKDFWLKMSIFSYIHVSRWPSLSEYHLWVWMTHCKNGREKQRHQRETHRINIKEWNLVQNPLNLLPISPWGSIWA